MNEIEILLLCIAMYLCPIVFWCIRVRPRLSAMEWRAMLCGVIATLCMLFPGYFWGFGAWAFVLLRIWVFAIPTLLVAYSIVWIIAAVRKTRYCLTGGILAAAIPVISGLLFGNLVSVGIGLAFMYMLLRVRREYLELD